MWTCLCACYEQVPVTEVVSTTRFNCMIVRLDDHPSKPPANNPVCDGAGAYVDLHPYGTHAFRMVLDVLGVKDPRILIPRFDKKGPELV